MRLKAFRSILPLSFLFFAICLCAAFYSTLNSPLPAARAAQQSSFPGKRRLAPVVPFTIVNKYPHDPGAFTEGLLYANGFLYESTGLNGESSLRKVELKTGRVVKEHELPSKYFGEGLALWGGSLVQITWKSGTAFEYDPKDFELKSLSHYRGEGWGLTEDKNSLIMSNGTPELAFIDPKTFEVKRRVQVRDMGKPVVQLNELEYIKGKIFANVWHDDHIAIISPQTGEVAGWLDCSCLRSQMPPSAEVLNGIAYDAKNDRIFVTGKLWPSLFEIRIAKNPRKSF
ncbi:MAG: glutaminyl-peptide cyclotransferase [Syntrophobacteraceae bacterium]